MKVIYTDPTGRDGTYHPKLGYLKSGKSFELDDGEAKKYVESGLLKEQPSVIPAPAATVREHGGKAGIQKNQTDKIKEKTNGKSTNR